MQMIGMDVEQGYKSDSSTSEESLPQDWGIWGEKDSIDLCEVRIAVTRSPIPPNRPQLCPFYLNLSFVSLYLYLHSDFLAPCVILPDIGLHDSKSSVSGVTSYSPEPFNAYCEYNSTYDNVYPGRRSG
jgi:hypothetical protein